jgi:signal transduction histidine kinase
MLRTKQSALVASVGGAWFLDTRFLLLTTPLVITTSILTTSSQFVVDGSSSLESFSIYSRLLFANIFALVICAAWVVLFAKTVFKNRAIRPVPLFAVILFSAGVGALKGAATGLGTWGLSIETDLAEAITSRVWQTTLLGAWLIPAVTLVAARLAALQEQREALVAERVANTIVETGAAQTRDNQAALRAFAAMAKAELGEISNSQESNGGGSAYAKAIRKLVTDQLRPLSHRIWDQENKRISSFSFAEVSRNAIFGFSQARLIVSFVYFVTSIPAIMRYLPLGESILRALSAAIFIYLGLALSSLFKPKKYWHATAHFVLSILTISYLTYISGELIFGYVSGFRLFETLLAVWLWLVQLTFISAFLSGVRKGGTEIKQEFAELYGSESIDRAVRLSQARIQNRDFANYLHGQVQNKLLSVALGLERGKATKEELQQALAMVEDILKSLDLDYKTTNSGQIDAEIEKINNQWLGFVNITWNIDSAVNNLETRQKILFVQVAEEAISNSVRHGLSKNIVVSAKVVAGALQVEVTDDGIGPRDGKPGLGSVFFKNVSRGQWSLTQEPGGGSKLTVNF